MAWSVSGKVGYQESPGWALIREWALYQSCQSSRSFWTLLGFCWNCWVVLSRGRSWILMILVGPFQLRLFCDSVEYILYPVTASVSLCQKVILLSFWQVVGSSLWIQSSILTIAMDSLGIVHFFLRNFVSLVKGMMFCMVRASTCAGSTAMSSLTSFVICHIWANINCAWNDQKSWLSDCMDVLERPAARNAK